MKHTRSFIREMCWKHALRKQRITQEVYKEENYFRDLHTYSKNKIHCSCSICSGEVWSVGANSLYQNTITDIRKLESMEEQIDELNQGE